jgi:hypothetical protein
MLALDSFVERKDSSLSSQLSALSSQKSKNPQVQPVNILGETNQAAVLGLDFTGYWVLGTGY